MRYFIRVMRHELANKKTMTKRMTKTVTTTVTKTVAKTVTKTFTIHSENTLKEQS